MNFSFRKKTIKGVPDLPDPSQTMVRSTKEMQEATVNFREHLRYVKKLRDIVNRIHSSPNLDSILIDLKEDILSLLDAERITIYAIAPGGKDIYSKFKDGEDDEIQEIRVPLTNKSIAGYVANNRKPISIQDAYDVNELSKIDEELQFNRDFDMMSGFRTKHVLAVPVVLKSELLGVIQLINKVSGEKFLQEDQQALMEMAETLAIAFHNHRKAKGRQRSKYDLLIAENIIQDKTIDNASVLAREQNVSVETILMRDFNVEKRQLGRALTSYYGLPFFQFKSSLPIPFALIGNIKDPTYLRNQRWVPLRQEAGTVIIAIENPKALDKLDDIKRQFKNFELWVALAEDILKTIDYFWGAQKKAEDKKTSKFKEMLEEEALEEEEEKIDLSVEEVTEEDNVVLRLVNKIIKDAYEQNASDIHIEPSPNKKEDTVIRFRVDGTCHEYQKLPAKFKRAVVSRIKIMSSLDIANRRIPQDGKIQFKRFSDLDIELRVATLPTIGENENVVMRILAASEPIPLDKIGMREPDLKRFKKMIHLPYGIVLVVGPTGSGKTTTLHSALGYINTPERKIWTAEDPVEITQKGLCQVQTNPKAGYTFAMAMRAFLRADPDVIMVGEMRDFETSSIGIEASLTGHLVFSTLHTNSAPETIVRLLDMGIDPFNFGDALIGVLAQRLVRTLCKKCKQEYHPTEEEFQDLLLEYNSENVKVKGHQETNYIPLPSHEIRYTDDLTLYKPKGCSACNKGYKGRMGIHELLAGGDEITSLIHKKAVVEKLRNQAIELGMTTLKQDGILKVLAGHTDIAQVRAVCIK